MELKGYFHIGFASDDCCAEGGLSATSAVVTSQERAHGIEYAIMQGEGLGTTRVTELDSAGFTGQSPKRSAIEGAVYSIIVMQ